MGTVRGVAHWMGVFAIKPNNQMVWAQMGQYQGVPWAFAVPEAQNSVRQYWENTNTCGVYHKGDLGPPPAPNTPYYVTVSTSVISVYCGIWFVDANPVYYRYGSFNNAPAVSGHLPLSMSYVAQAGIEAIAENGYASPGIFPAYYGHNNAPAPHDSYGLNIFTNEYLFRPWASWFVGSGTSIIDNGPYAHTRNGSAGDWGHFYVTGG